jgi:hypothetical protein
MRKILIAAGLLLGLGEIVMAFGIEEPVPTAAGGVALIVATVWTWRGGRISAAVLGALCLLELVSVPFFWAAESSPPLTDVLTFLYFGVVSVAGVVASVTTLTRRHPAVA